ncbi:hypothetical protein BVX97_01930 [bacterium E08(2017)]|nr:hypothetical protein BVX97_01930 [bacterium E08(2017)]
MAVFVYKARTRSGEKIEDTIEANDRRAAMSLIEGKGYIPVSVTEKSAASAGGKKKSGPKFVMHRGQAKLGAKESLLFATELSDLLSSGMTLGNALGSLANRKTGSESDAIIAELRDEVIRGSSFSEALSKHPKSFSGLFVSMIRAGEASGALDEVLKRLVHHYERVQDTKDKVVMALVYPVIVLVLGIATMVFAIAWIIPKFKTIFEQMDDGLPFMTMLLIGMADVLTQWGWLIAICIVFLAVMFNRAINTEKGRFWWDGVLLKLPLIKGIVACNIFSNFARTLSTLLTNGVPVLQALGIVEQTVGNVVVSKEIKNARERVTDGTTISGPLAAGKIFPKIMTDMLAVGEETGDMAGALSHIGRRYDNELERNIKIFTTALEPILILFVAIGVGFVAISVLMAVFNMTNGLDV